MVLEHLEGTLYELIGDWRAIEEVCVAGRVHADCLPHQVGGLSASECMLIGSLIRCAFILAVVTLFAALYSHPWYVVLWSDRNYTLDEVIGFEGARS